MVVLPTRADASEDAVRAVLQRTGATVFASDAESLREIDPLCESHLAADCALFFDYAPHRRAGTGTLDVLDANLPDELATWLRAIAAHETVRTDRFHVAVAAAMLGKQVELVGEQEIDPRPASLEPEGAHTLSRLEDAARRTRHPVRLAGSGDEPEVTSVIVTRNRPQLALRALDSLGRQDLPISTIVIDSNSSPQAAKALEAGCRGRPRVMLERCERNLGPSAGRRRGVELSDTELVLIFDDDAELMPGALAHLVSELEADPTASAATATVVGHDGRVMHSGGSMQQTSEIVHFGLIGQGALATDDALPPSGPTAWVPSTVLLARRELFERFPWQTETLAYFEDNEWAYRVASERPESFRRSREALALHLRGHRPVQGDTFEARSVAVEWLAALAYFYERHGLIVSPWTFSLVPELVPRGDGFDLAGARLLMELLSEKGTDWTFTAWMNGELAGLLGVNRRA